MWRTDFDWTVLTIHKVTIWKKNQLDLELSKKFLQLTETVKCDWGKKAGAPLKTKVIIHVRQCSVQLRRKKPTKTIPIFFFAAADPNFNKQKMVLLKVRHCCKTYTHKKFVNILRLEFPHALTWISIKNCAMAVAASVPLLHEWMQGGCHFLSIKNEKKKFVSTLLPYLNYWRDFIVPGTVGQKWENWWLSFNVFFLFF